MMWRDSAALTINWHDRSILPERLWDPFYGELIGDLKNRKFGFRSPHNYR